MAEVEAGDGKLNNQNSAAGDGGLFPCLALTLLSAQWMPGSCRSDLRGDTSLIILSYIQEDTQIDQHAFSFYKHPAYVTISKSPAPVFSRLFLLCVRKWCGWSNGVLLFPLDPVIKKATDPFFSLCTMFSLF